MFHKNCFGYFGEANQPNATSIQVDSSQRKREDQRSRGGGLHDCSNAWFIRSKSQIKGRV
jgi:hypothetical protein